MNREDFYKELRVLQSDSDKAINDMEQTFFESLKGALSDHLSEQQVNEVLDSFKPPFDRLRTTMRMHWDIKFTEETRNKGRN